MADGRGQVVLHLTGDLIHAAQTLEALSASARFLGYEAIERDR